MLTERFVICVALFLFSLFLESTFVSLNEFKLRNLLSNLSMASSATSQDELKQKALDHWELINKLARKRFIRATDADEAALYVLDALEKDNWKRLGAYKGRAEFTPFFASVCWRLLEDFSRKKFGRHSTPGWIQKAGGIWLVLYRLLCMERFSLLEAVNIVHQRKKKTLQKIEEIAEQILGTIAGCGEHRHKEVVFDENELLAGETEKKATTAEKREKELLFSALAIEILDGESSGQQQDALRKILQQKIQLSPTDRVLLKLHYQEELSITQAGSMLGMNRFQAHGRIRRALKKIRNQFQDAGCEEELKVLIS